jgi:hypothetical protein
MVTKIIILTRQTGNVLDKQNQEQIMVIKITILTGQTENVVDEQKQEYYFQYYLNYLLCSVTV